MHSVVAHSGSGTGLRQGGRAAQVNLPNSAGVAAVKMPANSGDFADSLVCIVRDHNPRLGQFFQGVQSPALSGRHSACASVA